MSTFSRKPFHDMLEHKKCASYIVFGIVISVRFDSDKVIVEF